MELRTDNDANQTNFGDLSHDSSILFGKLLAHPDPGDEIVISGLSGTYPDSKNVEELKNNLFNKVDMVTDDNRRFEHGHPEIPRRHGKLPDIDHFDSGYFGIHPLQATCMDPALRLIFEKVIEALFDAAIHPSDLEGTKTGVFMSACVNESEKSWYFDKQLSQGNAITGCERSMQAHRISYFLKLKGPSFVCDTACSSFLYAFEAAYKAIRTGQCDSAIVGGTNLCMHPFVSLQFARLGVLSLDGKCKVFDNAANGYVRSEAISVVILQKSKQAKRNYSTVLHAKTNCDGYKDSGINFPSKDMQTQLLKEFYEECDFVKPSDLSFLEAHGTGTTIGDPEELQAIEEVFLKGRVTPLLIGSVKSNLGHTEPSSGACSITKAIIAFETGYIPPNIHYQIPNAEIKSLQDGRLKVVTEQMPFNDNRGLIGINSFGFGGANCHILLKHNPKQKVNNGKFKDDIPRLVYVSGRTQEAVNVLLDDVIENHVDSEHIRLMQEIFRKNVVGHDYRGYSLVAQSGEILRSLSFLAGGNVPNLVICFGVIDEEIRKEAKDLLKIPLVATSIERIHEVLIPKGFSIYKILFEKSNDIRETILANFFLQIVFADILKVLNCVPNKIFGLTKELSVGTLACAYFDGALNLKQAIDCACAVAYAVDPFTENGDRNIKNNGEISIKIQQALEEILVKPRTLSSKVIFEDSNVTSVYLLSCLDSTKVLKKLRADIKKNSVIFEVGNGYINKSLKENLDYGNNSFVTMKGGISGLLTSFGRLYELGYNLQIQNLFPVVEFPLSRGTPMISPKIKWNHSKKWWVKYYKYADEMTLEGRNIGIDMKDKLFSSIEGHIIDGRNLFPATGYLMLVWDALAALYNRLPENVKIVFENCKFRRACSIPKKGTHLTLTVVIRRVSGYFTVMEGGGVVVTGKVSQLSEDESELVTISAPTKATNVPSMTNRDIYKELKLRGYNYKGEFRKLNSCNISAQEGFIPWDGNWVSFIDNMLQMKILQEDTRLLYVPTTIRRLAIDAKAHIKYANSFGQEHPDLTVYASKDTGIIRSGCIEIRGLNASTIARRKYLGSPVLEKYVFVPNVATLKTKQAVRVNMQILLENINSIKVKVVELIARTVLDGKEELEPLGPLVHEALEGQPLIQPNITSYKIGLEKQKIEVEDKSLLAEVGCSLVIGFNILQKEDALNLVSSFLSENGFILSREPLDFDTTSCSNKGITIVTAFTTDQEKLIFCRKNKRIDIPVVVRISSEDKHFTWLPRLKDEVKKDHYVLVYAQDEPINGVLGLVNCITKEPGSQNVKLVFIQDNSAPKFDIKIPFYQEQLKKNLAINVFKNGHWGTYRHLLLEQGSQVEVEHCYLNTLVRGDLSSLKWIEGPLRYDTLMDSDRIISVYYAAVNFKDVMMASGRINVDAVTKDRRQQECVQGMEFSGRTQDGKRVMGIVANGACASLVKAEKYLLWNVPNNWSLADAVTVPVVYATCMFALFEKGKMRQGNSVLIHSGTGGIGLAAITLALHTECTVYTTVSSLEKREFLKKKFPQLTDLNISSSRDTSFEQHIMTVTNGRGVDIVLNSLAEEKLLASVRCLAKGGNFLEIGKFDMASDNTLNLLLFEKEATFHGIMLDVMFNEDCKLQANLFTMVQEGIESGAVKPLSQTVFHMNESEKAFRHMSTGKHMGKVVLQIRQEEAEKITKPNQLAFPAIPRYNCDGNKTYIICGGLGGFGLELADWLVLRGCTKLILTSRNGIKTGYQAYRISIWQSYGCIVNISTEDITTETGCLHLIQEAKKLGPVHAIFNLAVVLKDALLENQTEEFYKISFGPKAYATECLDVVSRKWCPELRDFIIFSSVSCGRGNAGQTNYGMANSVMERICEERKREGFPALAIQWGAVGDVGLVAEMQDDSNELEIGGTLQQRISNCLQCLDIFLTQDESAVVSSMVVAEKRAGSGGAENIVDAVADILGVKNLSTISLQATLAEVGMDSMTAVEIKQTLEREFEVFLTPQDIKTLTFEKLIKIQADKDAENESETTTVTKPAHFGIDMIYRQMADASIVNIPIVSIKNKTSDRLVLFPGIEGIAKSLEPLYKHLDADLVVLQYPNNTQKDTIEDMANTYLPLIEERIAKSEQFKIICYSFGAAIALEAFHQLERKGYKGIIICIDSSPDYFNGMLQLLDVTSDDQFQVSLLAYLMSFYMPYDDISRNLETLEKCDGFEARITVMLNIVGPNNLHTPEHQRACAISLYKRLKALVNWSPKFQIKSKVVLFKPTLANIKLSDEDYGLSKICESPVEVKVFQGNHITILENPDMPQEINKIFGII